MSRYITAEDDQGVGKQRGWRLWRGTIVGGPFLMVQTGMGRERACAAVQRVIDTYPVKRVLNMGFGAAANDALDVGDLVVCTHFHSPPARQDAAIPDPQPADACMAAAAQQARPANPAPHPPSRLYHGGCLTVDYLVTEPQEKRRLGQRFGVQAIDMESFPLAIQAAQHGLPFLSMRAISDDVNEALPPFDTYLHPDGGVDWPAALRRWRAHPADLLGLLRMARHARRAQQALAAWLPGIIPLLGS